MAQDFSVSTPCQKGPCSCVCMNIYDRTCVCVFMYMLVYVCACACSHAIVNIWRSEGSLFETVLPFSHVGPRIKPGHQLAAVTSTHGTTPAAPKGASIFRLQEFAHLSLIREVSLTALCTEYTDCCLTGHPCSVLDMYVRARTRLRPFVPLSVISLPCCVAGSEVRC